MGGWNWGGRRVIGQGDGVGMSTEQREGKGGGGEMGRDERVFKRGVGDE